MEKPIKNIMEVVNLLHLGNRSEFRQWLKENHNKEKCCWVVTYRSKCPPEWPAIPYIEVVEEALCFGWIDSTLKRLPDGRLAQRLSPRRTKSQVNQDPHKQPVPPLSATIPVVSSTAG